VLKPALLDASDTQQYSLQSLLTYATTVYRSSMTELPAAGSRDWEVTPATGARFLTCNCHDCAFVEAFLSDPMRDTCTVHGPNATIKGQ
jgi:hypothetical protein